MQDKIYTQNLCDDFLKEFPKGWIDDLNFEERAGQTAKMKGGIKRIDDYQRTLFLSLSRLVFSANHLIDDKEIENLDQLLELTYDSEIVPESKKSSKNILQNRYLDFLQDIQYSINLVKYHDSLTRKHFTPQARAAFIHAIPLNKKKENVSKYVSLLDLICEACWKEYVFSYDEKYISDVVLLKEHLDREKKKEAEPITIFLEAAIDKLSFLLYKLSLFSEDKIISYNFNFKEREITLDDISQLKEDDLLKYFICFMDVDRLTPEQVLGWQKEVLKDDVPMWNLVFLMRYYCKKTKSTTQIENLITVFEKHYKENERDNESIINAYACRSARNYMYNSRFSFYCQNSNDYSFDQLKKDLEQINSIQNETFIKNYHPYLKAIEFLKNKLEEGLIKNRDKETLQSYLDYLDNCFSEFKNKVDWCKLNQPYLIQLRYNFSTRKYKDTDIDVFYPSSFCRPLRFSHLNERILQYSHDIAFLHYQVKHQDEKIELLEAKQQIAGFEKKNLETMSLVFTVTTFLVGMLSIFIGNNGSVSIFSKMEYVAVLGLVLLLFICVGYFVISDVLKKLKPWIFGGLTIIFLSLLSVISYNSGKNSIIASSEETKAKIDSVESCVDSTNILTPDHNKSVIQQK